MSSISWLHEEVFTHLAALSARDPQFRFTIRKSDKENRLSKGYYFYGNDHYLAVSFWSGTNWKNRTPNIHFVIVPSEKKTYIEVAVSDSDLKQKFVEQFIFPELQFYGDNGKYFRNVSGETFLVALDNFINNEKLVIDRIIRKQESFFGKVDSENRIGFISEKLFNLRLNKVRDLRSARAAKANIDEPVYVKSFRVRRYQGIDYLTFGELNADTQWIFLTGENGSGKTTVLRALTLALSNDAQSYPEYGDTGHYEITLEFFLGKVAITHSVSPNFGRQKQNILTKGFAAYGASRLIINDSGTQARYSRTELKRRLEPSYSIFHHDGVLMDFAQEIRQLFNNINVTEVKEKLNIIIETLVECINPLANIIIEGLDDTADNIDSNTLKCLFQEQDVTGAKFIPVTFQQLSSGTKSLIAMLGDLIIRLFRQQPEIYDLAELKGIVLIDEIDIHFHPSQQKNLIQTLTEAFPKIQFIVTTHSPVPLLGAPKNSVIFRIARTVKEGVFAERIDDKLNFYDLLPNTILTSPIFGLPSVTPNAQTNSDEIRTEKNWKELKFNDEVEKELQEIYKRLSK